MNFIRRGNTAGKTLFALEDKIGLLQEEIKAVSGMPVPWDEYRATLKARFEAILFRRTPQLPFDTLMWPQYQHHAQIPDVIGYETLLYLLGVDVVVDKILARVKENAEPVGLPAMVRVERIADLKRQIRSLEAEAEVEALALEAQGHTVLRRADADVEVIFDVWANLPAAVEQAASPAAA